MDRRTFAAAVAETIALLAMTGCDTESKPDATATLLNNSKVHNAVKNLVDAVDTLNGDVDDFDSENWREVVPKVKESATEVENAVAELRTALGYSD